MGFVKARKQAQANADRSGHQWVVWASHAPGIYFVELDWKGRTFAAEVFLPTTIGSYKNIP